ncbi:tyrosine recombinase [Raoultibacter phocaeensis]|uniref:tyrosine recombinase n=1 Tax=Raoultibacter phocaeensis TaxID=2479841 RepID=UPI00111B656F|nr:tyrosine recombinase [Raoultibacter phocaeensis]
MGEPGGTRASALAEQYLETLRVERGMSPHTLRAYRIDIFDFLRWADRHEVDALALTYRQLRLYLGELDRAQYSRTTINRKLSSLRGYFGWMCAEGAIEEDPGAVLQGPKQPKSLPHTVKPADMAKILTVHSARDLSGNERDQTPSDMRDQALLELLYACGARISEASDLKLSGVDLENAHVRLFGKGSKERIVPIHELAASSMARYLHFGRPKLLEGRACEYFFVSTRGNKMSTDAMRKMFKATLRAAGVDETLSPHDMRHTFATDLLGGGADLRSVQEMLGHARLSTTQIYTHLTPDRLKEVHSQAHPRSGR